LFYFIERPVNVTGLKLNPAAAVDDNERVQTEVATRYPDSHPRIAFRSLLKSE
jgi:hypothetical protein